MQATTHPDPVKTATQMTKEDSRTMRAIVQRKYGSAETLKLGEIARPEVEAEQSAARALL